MKIEGKNAASNLALKQGMTLDTERRCYMRWKKIFGWFHVGEACRSLPKADYVLLFRTLYAKCEACSPEDFERSSTIQVSLVYHRTRKLIVHECRSMAEGLEIAARLSQALGLRVRDSATDRTHPRWIS